MNRSLCAQPIVVRSGRRLKCVLLAICMMTSAGRDVAAQPTATSAQGKTTIADWDFNNGNQGWLAQNQSQVSAKDGRLHVTSTGNDPFIGVPIKAPTGWKTLTLRVRTPQNLNSQLFWTTTAEPETSESKSVRFRLPSRGSRFRETVVYFHTAAPLRSLRLDPARCFCVGMGMNEAVAGGTASFSVQDVIAAPGSKYFKQDIVLVLAALLAALLVLLPCAVATAQLTPMLAPSV